jgi:hypothetical protein
MQREAGSLPEQVEPIESEADINRISHPTRGSFREDEVSLLVSPGSRTTGRPVRPQA